MFFQPPADNGSKITSYKLEWNEVCITCSYSYCIVSWMWHLLWLNKTTVKRREMGGWKSWIALIFFLFGFCCFSFTVFVYHYHAVGRFYNIIVAFPALLYLMKVEGHTVGVYSTCSYEFKLQINSHYSSYKTTVWMKLCV